MTNYTLGFMFAGEQVALIRKRKPEWQNGALNGIGGKIHDGEDPRLAMVREFGEETGFLTQPAAWTLFCVMRGADWSVRCYYAFHSLAPLRTCTQEEIVIVKLDELANWKHVHNLTWLLPLALDCAKRDSLNPIVVNAEYP